MKKEKLMLIVDGLITALCVLLSIIGALFVLGLLVSLWGWVVWLGGAVMEWIKEDLLGREDA